MPCYRIGVINVRTRLIDEYQLVEGNDEHDGRERARRIHAFRTAQPVEEIEAYRCTKLEVAP